MDQCHILMKQLHWLPIRYSVALNSSQSCIRLYMAWTSIPKEQVQDKKQHQRHTNDIMLHIISGSSIQQEKEQLQIEVLAIWLPSTGMYYQTILKQPITYNSSKNY